MLTRSSDVTPLVDCLNGAKGKVSAAAKVKGVRPCEMRLQCGRWVVAPQEPVSGEQTLNGVPCRPSHSRDGDEDEGRPSRLLGLGVNFKNCA